MLFTFRSDDQGRRCSGVISLKAMHSEASPKERSDQACVQLKAGAFWSNFAGGITFFHERGLGRVEWQRGSYIRVRIERLNQSEKLTVADAC